MVLHGCPNYTTWSFSVCIPVNNTFLEFEFEPGYRPYAYDVTEGRPAALGVKRNTATCVIAKHAARGANPASHTAGLARPGPRTERLSANAHCQHNTCALRDTRLASLLWRCDPLWRQCIRSIVEYRRTYKGMLFHMSGPVCLIDLCANLVIGFKRWTFEEILVG